MRDGFFVSFISSIIICVLSVLEPLFSHHCDCIVLSLCILLHFFCIIFAYFTQTCTNVIFDIHAISIYMVITILYHILYMCWSWKFFLVFLLQFISISVFVCMRNTRVYEWHFVLFTLSTTYRFFSLFFLYYKVHSIT